MKHGQRAFTKPSMSQMFQSVFSEAEQVMKRDTLSMSITSAGLSIAPLQNHEGPFSWKAHQELWELLLSQQAEHIMQATGYLRKGMPPVQMDQDPQKWWGTKSQQQARSQRTIYSRDVVCYQKTQL